MTTDQANPPPATDARRYHRDGSSPTAGGILVFGSNLAGRHGAGAARLARESYGAKPGVGVGRTGQAYAIPTKDGRSGGPLTSPAEILSYHEVRSHITEFIAYAWANPDLEFLVTRVACGLAGAVFNDRVIGPLFATAPGNCSFATDWKPYLEHAPAPARARPRPH